MPSKRGYRVRRRLKLALLCLLLPCLWFMSGYIHSQFSPPQVALVLGGSATREAYAAELAQANPQLEIWVSSGSRPEQAQSLFKAANIPQERVRLDYRAVDTVTNFTTLVEDLAQQGIQNLYLVTSDYHMGRARVIAEIVLGSRQIRYQPIVVPSAKSAKPHKPETWFRNLRDGVRSLVWVLTGKTGAELIPLAQKLPIIGA